VQDQTGAGPRGRLKAVPSIAPSHVYAFFALIAVSTILISAFSAYAVTLRTMPEKEQLQNLLNYIASKGYELVTLATATNATSRAVLQLPSTIGSKHYWARLRNEDSKAWVEGALGSIQEDTVNNRSYLPESVFASGKYASSNGPAVLECYLNASTIHLHLSLWRENI
jgi:hypothetical protein